jgi:hypothetical protein
MMLLPGFRLMVAPNFHVAIDWSGRLSLGARVEQTAAGPVARPPWRPASADEQAVLLLDPTQTTARAELLGCLCLLVLPSHLRAAFWDLLAQAPELGQVPAEGFSAFVAETARFLAFKQMPVPAGAVFDLVVTRPGPAPSLSTAVLWGLINLGEDAASVVFLNLPAGEVPVADYPPVRLQLGPGEGARVPTGMLIGTAECERDQPDVLLLIRWPGDCGGEASPGPNLTGGARDRSKSPESRPC